MGTNDMENINNMSNIFKKALTEGKLITKTFTLDDEVNEIEKYKFAINILDEISTYLLSSDHNDVLESFCDNHAIMEYVSLIIDRKTLDLYQKMHQIRTFDEVEEKKRTIYIITAGDYSDYHIIGATTNKATAEAIKKYTIINDGYDYADDVNIVEYEDAASELLFEQTDKYIPRWRVLINYEGNVEDVKLISYSETHEAPKVSTLSNYIQVNCCAEDEEHAIKIAADEKAKYFAEHMGL